MSANVIGSRGNLRAAQIPGTRRRFVEVPLVFVVLSLGLAACYAGSVNTNTGTPVAPAISLQPASVTVTAGQSATFSVAATGTAPLSYQWQNAATGANIAGATSASYTIASTTSADSGNTYRVVVSNVAGKVTSNAATLTVNGLPVITTQPADQTVIVGQTATFSVVATGTAPLSYLWQYATTSTNITGATSASYTTPATVLGDSGQTFQVVVSNAYGSQTSRAALLTVNSTPPPSSVTVLTYHNDNTRQGLNANETILTTANVNQTTFGKLGVLPVTGLVDAEPLYVPGLTINGAKHNVVYVVTEEDMVYAFDADTPGAPLWSVSVAPSPEIAPTTTDIGGCTQVSPNVGITSTPVIDPKAGPNGTMFLVAMSLNPQTNALYDRLHAIDLTTGAELNGGPTVIQATASGQTFDPKQYVERSALLLLNGTIYLTWTSHCDNGSYQGWLMGYSESNLQQTSVINTTPNGNGGSIWMAGAGPAADSSGYIYYLTANGTFDTSLDANGFPVKGDFGNSFLKVSASGGGLSVADYFTMHNTVTESNNDQDLGSGGAIVLPDLTDGSGTVQHLAVGAGKDGHMYVVNRDNMGKFNASSDSAIYQEIPSAFGAVFSAPAYFNNTIYYGAVHTNLLAFPIVNALVSLAPFSSGTVFNYPGTTPSISSNGTSNGIVWAIENGSIGVLHAFNATNLTELYNSKQAGTRDQFNTSGSDKFVTPMIANGKVYVGTPNAVVVFGTL